MSFKVCDAIMGSGKSSAAITYMNEHPEQKFIYITPYCAEATRIQKSCPKLNFFVPQKTNDSRWSVTSQTSQALDNRRNVASTHSAFTFYTEEMLQIIREEEYTLIIDESINVLKKLEISEGDLILMTDVGIIVPTEDGYRLGDKEYGDGVYGEFYRTLKSQNIVKVSDSKKKAFLYWELPIQNMAAFKDVYILTYLFEGSSLCYYLKMNGVEYSNIGVVNPSADEYRFDDNKSDIPEYVSRLPELIDILQHDRMNLIGKDSHALSDSWFGKSPKKSVKRGRIAPDADIVRKNLLNYYNHICKVPAEQRMWTTFKKRKVKLDGNGLAKGFVVLNTCATNDYRHKTALAYCANLFVNVGCKNYFLKHGVKVDEDLYALSTMLQWIWRSAIRDGKPINIYIPSKRMRDLLTAWIETTAKGGAQNAEQQNL